MVARATRMSAFDRAKKASRAWLLCPTSRSSSSPGCPSLWGTSARGPRQRERRRSTHRQPAAQGDAGHRCELRGPEDDEPDAEEDPAEALGEVDQRQQPPAPLALEHAGLGAHVGERERRDADHQRGREAVEVQHRVEHGGEREADRAEHECAAQPDAEHHPLDGDHLLGVRGDPAGAGGLQPQRQHADHQQGAHQRRERAVRLLADRVRREHGVAVGRQVHDPHRDGDDGTAAQPAAGLGRHLAHGPEAYGRSVRRDRHSTAPVAEGGWIVAMRRAVAREAPVVLWALALALLVLGPALGPGLPAGPRHGLGARPGAARRRARPRVGAAARGAVGRRRGGARRDRPGDAAAEAGARAGPGRRRGRRGAAAGPGRRAGRARRSGWSRSRSTAGTRWSPSGCSMGAWPLLVGYAVLPWLLGAARRWRAEGRLPRALLVLVPLGCLSASAGLATAVAVLAGAAGKGRTAKAALLVAAGNAPWLVAGLLHASSATSDSAAAEVFALRGEGSVPAPLAALTLGGIWNTAVQPGSRTGALGWVALVALVGLAAVGARSWWRRTPARERTALLVCWAIGWGLAVLTWLAPGAVGWASEHVAGAGVVRDGARALVLCAPLLVVLVAEGVRVLATRAPRERVARAALARRRGPAPRRAAARPGPRRRAPGRAGRLPGGVRRGAAAARRHRDGDVLVLPLSSYRAPAWNHRHLVLDPIGRYLTPRLRGERRAGRRRGAALGGGPAGATTRPGPWPSRPPRSGPRRWAGSGSVRWSPTRPHRATRRPRSPASRCSTTPTCGSIGPRRGRRAGRPDQLAARDGGRLAGLPGAVGTGAAGRRPAPPDRRRRGSRSVAAPSDRRVAIVDTRSGRLCHGLREGPASEDFDHVRSHGRGWGDRSRVDVRPARLADRRAC